MVKDNRGAEEELKEEDFREQDLKQVIKNRVNLNTLCNYFDFLSDYFIYWMKCNTEHVIREAAQELGINKDVVEKYVNDEETWCEFSNEDGIIAAQNWIAELTGKDDGWATGYHFYKYAFRQPWDTFVNCLAEILTDHYEYEEDEANNIADDYSRFEELNVHELTEDKIIELEEIVYSFLPPDDHYIELINEL